MSGWANFANFGNSAIQGFNNYENMLAARQQREMQAAAAKAYGEAMMKMSQPQPWRVPMANDYTPPPPAMTLPNFMQAMPKGMDPAAMGMAVDRFAPIARQNEMDQYRDQQIRLGQERNTQGQQRLELAQARIDARDKQNQAANDFRAKEIAIQQTGLAQRNPTAAREWDRVKTEFAKANENVMRFQQMANQLDTASWNMKPDVYDARRMEVMTSLKAAVAELDAAKASLDRFDMSGQGLPQPTLAPTMAPPPAAAPQPPPAAAPAPRPVPPPAAIEKLRMEPDTAKFFDQKYGPGASKQFLQPAAPQNGMPVSPGPQGGPEVASLTMRGPDADQKRAIALRSPAEANAIDMRDRMLRDREAAASAIRPGQRTAGPAWSKPGSMATRPDIQAEATQSPTEAPQPLVQDPETLVSGENWGVQRTDAEIRAADEKLRAALAARGVQGVDTMDRGELRVRDAMLNMVDETKPLVELYRDAAKRTGELRQKYAPKGGAQGGQSNPYLGYSMEQLNAEMKKLAAREFAARTEADKAAVKRDFDLVFKASEEMAKRRQKGS